LKRDQTYRVTLPKERKMGGAGWAGLVVAVLLLPPMIAWRRQVVATGAILTIVLLAGWTVVGWVFALIWACVAPTRQQAEMERATLERLSGTAAKLNAAQRTGDAMSVPLPRKSRVFAIHS
jgi:hypothetical protein